MTDAVDLVLGFANTVDVDCDSDALADAASLRAWLEDGWKDQAEDPEDRPSVSAIHELLSEVEVGDRDLARLRGLRDALRDVLSGHARGSVDPDATARLDAYAADAPLRVTFSAPGFDGRPVVTTAGVGARQLVGALLAAMVAVDDRGEWRRLKLCNADDCRWAYQDRSRNRSRRWCAMDGSCGNRAKVRAYRARQAAHD